MKRVLIHLVLIVLILAAVNHLLKVCCPKMNETDRHITLMLIFVFIYIFLSFFNFFKYDIRPPRI